MVYVQNSSIPQTATMPGWVGLCCGLSYKPAKDGKWHMYHIDVSYMT